MKISIKREVQQIALDHLRDIEFKDLMKFYKHTKEPFSYLFNDMTLASGNPLRFMKNQLQNDC